MVLFHGPGVADYEIGTVALSPETWARIKANACRFLRSSGGTDAAEFLERHPFRVMNATNHFQDEFVMMALQVSMEEYVTFSEWQHRPENRYVLPE